MQLDASASTAALATHIGKPLALEAPWDAAGVSEIVEENMSNAARVHAIERGKVIGRYAMIAFGGGAPLHAGRLAEKLGMRTVVVPVGASVGSAIGFLRAPVAFEVVRSRRVQLSRFDAGAANQLLAQSAQRATAVVRQAVPQETLTTRRSVDARYIGQGHELTLDLPGQALEAEDAARLREQFEQRYLAVYGVTMPQQDVELVTWSVTVTAPTAAPVVPPAPTRRRAAAPVAQRNVYEPALGRLTAFAVYQRDLLAPGDQFHGPALVEEAQTTSVIPASFSAHIDGAGSIVMESRNE